MRIGVDVDDTITNTWKALIPHFSRMFNVPVDKLKKSRGYYYSVSDLVSLDEYFEKILPLLDEIMPNVEIKDNVKEVIDKLYELGHSIVFITARSGGYTDPYKLTKDYLDKYKIKYDKIVVGVRRKDQICLEENIDLFIDDSFVHCDSVSKLGIDVLMMDSEYNIKYKNFKHVKNWNEVYNYIKGR